MTYLLQRQLSKARARKISFSVLSGNQIRNSIQPLLFERTRVKNNKRHYKYPMNKSGLYHVHCCLSSYQQTLKVNSSLHPTMSVGKEDKKWYRTVTIKQSSKNDEEKVLTFDILVLDTYPDDVEQKRSTVVAVHGFPGSGNDFESLAAKLHEKGIRLIAPTSLGMTGSPITVDLLSEIDFSTEGRTKTLKLILKALNIHRVDMLLGHSAGAWTMYKVGATWENVGSLFGVNPGGAEPNRTLRPFSFLKFIAAALHWSVGRFLIMPFMTQIYKIIGFRGISKGNGVQLIAAQQYVTHQGFSEVPVNAELVKKKKLPVIIAYALNDKIVEPSICRKMAHCVLGIPEENIVRYTDDKTPSRYPFFVPEGWLTRCLVFARGGHIVHVAHEKEIVEQIENVLTHLAKAKNSSDNLSDKENNV